ncbi:MAG: hypothetical protein FJ399_14915 [Verrucomicrobia bacterium]|nr:hypothetical protein [Verrucomicrobiota bacterium]
MKSPFVLLALALLAGRAAAESRPNLVVFLADDLGYGDIGCFCSPRVQTPRLDRLAAEGARFTSFYGPASVCSPTRVGMLTGRLPFRLGIHTYIPNRSTMHLEGNWSFSRAAANRVACDLGSHRALRTCPSRQKSRARNNHRAAGNAHSGACLVHRSSCPPSLRRCCAP